MRQVSRARQSKRFSAARAFYLTILVISTFAGFSLIPSERHVQVPARIDGLLYSRADAGTRGLYSADGQILRTDEAVSWPQAPGA